MGKRSSFERIPRDFYPTPREAVGPLLPHLLPGTRFAEPCAGDGALLDHLSSAGHICVDAFDIEPQRADIACDDATMARVSNTDFYITNPPWDRTVLHPIILNLSRHKPTWLLFDADWMHTKQAAQFLPMLKAVVSVGRVKWIPDSKMTGKDNCCWYLFNASPESDPLDYPAVFYGRTASAGEAGTAETPKSGSARRASTRRRSRDAQMTHIEAYSAEKRRQDTLKHIEFMASLNMLDKISPGQLATTYHGMTKFQVEAEMVKHMPEGGEGK